MLLWWVGAVGLVLVVTKSRIFLPVRVAIARVDQVDAQQLAELVACPMCLGVWAGAALGFYLGLPGLEPLLMGGLVSLGSWFACGLCCSLELLVERLKR
jgi:hypothetical protein